MSHQQIVLAFYRQGHLVEKYLKTFYYFASRQVQSIQSALNDYISIEKLFTSKLIQTFNVNRCQDSGDVLGVVASVVRVGHLLHFRPGGLVIAPGGGLGLPELGVEYPVVSDWTVAQVEGGDRPVPSSSLRL